MIYHAYELRMRIYAHTFIYMSHKHTHMHARRGPYTYVYTRVRVRVLAHLELRMLTRYHDHVQGVRAHVRKFASAHAYVYRRRQLQA